MFASLIAAARYETIVDVIGICEQLPSVVAVATDTRPGNNNNNNKKRKKENQWKSSALLYECIQTQWRQGDSANHEAKRCGRGSGKQNRKFINVKYGEENIQFLVQWQKLSAKVSFHSVLR